VFAPDNNPNDTSDQIITNDGFFPDIAVADFRTDTRTQDTVTDQRVIANLVASILAINALLAVWQAAQQALGYTALANVPAKQINAASALVHHYRRAVYSHAQASIIDQYRESSITSKGTDRADEIINTRDIWLQQCREAVRAIRGEPRNTVELI
jgi:hypothetical protein